MAATATRKPPARKRLAPAKAPKRAAGKAAKAVSEDMPSLPKPNKLAKKLAGKVIKKIASRALESGAELIRAAADKAAATGSEAVAEASRRRLPIQRAVDIAVPLRVAWDEWMAFESLPEGVHTVIEIERDGDELIGQKSGLGSGDWAAEILDQRECQSFAWQSNEGSDCAGLVTFHELTERLTRIELNLDVEPTSVPETLSLATRLADHRAEVDLRRFKARLELINPDLYEDQPNDQHDPDPDDQDDPDKAA